MSEPARYPADGQLSTMAAQVSQVLVKQGEMAVDLAVIKEGLKAVPDHESRIRLLESAKAKMIGGAIAAGTMSGGVATLIYWALSRH